MPVAAPRPASALRTVRKLHLYFGLFIAPALLFFAFTGAAQTLSLHEAAGSSFHPPAWLARLGQLHKNQTIALAPRQESQAPRTAGASEHEAASALRPQLTLGEKERRHLPMKIFFLIVALGLLSSTASGIYMAYKYERNRIAVTATLTAGIAIPLLLLRL
jgi:hypothetical protein